MSIPYPPIIFNGGIPNPKPSPTFTSISLKGSSDQIELGETYTINAIDSSAPRVLNINDPGANANFVLDTVPLTITGTPVTNQVLTATSSTTADWQTPVSDIGITTLIETTNEAFTLNNSTQSSVVFTRTLPAGKYIYILLLCN